MQCHICEKATATESHHVYPIHLGGPTDGIQIPLCGNCHQFTHNTASRVHSGAALDGKLSSWYDRNPKSKGPVKIIIEAMVNAESQDMGDVLVPVSFKIPKKLRDRLHVVKTDAGFTNLNSFMIFLLVRATGGSIKDFDAMMDIIKEG